MPAWPDAARQTWRAVAAWPDAAQLVAPLLAVHHAEAPFAPVKKPAVPMGAAIVREPKSAEPEPA